MLINTSYWYFKPITIMSLALHVVVAHVVSEDTAATDVLGAPL